MYSIYQPNTQDISAFDIDDISQIINDSYIRGEKGMWKEGITRTSGQELRELIRLGKILLALSGKNVIGCVIAQILKENIGEFGMLAVHQDYLGRGIGKSLIQSAENKALQNKCQEMQFELLTPRHKKHPEKEKLKIWYTKLGYQPIETKSFEDMYPHLIEGLDVECDFTVWSKKIGKNDGTK